MLVILLGFILVTGVNTMGGGMGKFSHKSYVLFNAVPGFTVSAAILVYSAVCRARVI